MLLFQSRGKTGDLSALVEMTTHFNATWHPEKLTLFNQKTQKKWNEKSGIKPRFFYSTLLKTRDLSTPLGRSR